MKNRLFVLLAIFSAIFTALAAPASAHTRTIDHGGTYIGTNVVVPAGDEVAGDITVIGGDADIEGKVDGAVTIVGGTLTRGPDSEITGEVTPIGGTFSTWLPWTATSSSSVIARENAHMLVRLAYSAIILLMFLIFPVRVRTALDRIEHHPGLSAGVGVLALVAIIPVALLLIISIVGIPLVPVEFIAIFAAGLIGQAALGLLIGRRLYEMIRPNHTPSPLGAILLGLILLSAAEILPFVGALVTGLVWLVGIGAAILAFIRETHFMGPMAPVTPGAPGTRPPISGPPMTA